MKAYSIIIFISAVLFGCSIKDSEGQSNKYKKIITKDTEIREVISKEVDDTFYVYIKLPKFYHESQNNYPVLYLLDGDIAFNMATSIVRYLQYGKDIPDIIIVGIGYGTMMSDNEKNFRERDYSISTVEGLANSGGGENYFKFLRNELIPMIENQYRTGELRILNGYSLGGLAAVNVLLTDPDLFNYYIAGSPHLINDINYLISKTEGINLTDTKKIFVSVGEKEDEGSYHQPIEKLTSNLKNIKNLDLQYVEFENGTHFTCPPEALTYGLKFVFKEMKQ